MFTNSVLLTVIITVYNIAPYIGKCIESVMRQTYENIEILLIDDGSTDGSGEICDKYTQKDRRIKSYHIQNRGVVTARKFGVEVAAGEVITFIDGDDWIEQDMYECMLSAYLKDKPDMVTSGLIWEWTHKKTVLLDGIEEGVYEKDSIRKNILTRAVYDIKKEMQGITASVCDKLFRRSVLKEAIEGIDSQLTLGEDGAIVYGFVARADKIVVIHQAWYHYVQRENSANKTYGLAAFEKLYRLKNCLMDQYRGLGIEKEMTGQVDYYVKEFLYRVIEKLYQFDLRGIMYLFPYEAVPPKSKVILYGAGNIGRSYWKSLQVEDYAEVVGWVDKNYAELRKFGIPAESLEDAISKKYDFVVIAINDKDVVKEIKNTLLSCGVQKEKIVWKKSKIII